MTRSAYIFKRMQNTADKRIYELIMERGPITRSELKDITGMKLTTLSRALDELSGGGLITRAGLGTSGGGRRPALFAINPYFAYAVGVDISRTYTRITLFDMDLNALDSHVIAMDKDCTPQNIVGRITAWLEAAAERRGIPEDKILGIGVGAVGPIGRDGMIKRPRDFPAPGWDDVPIGRMIEESAGLPVITANGADCAVTGEYARGAAAGRGGVAAYIIIGTGIRCGVMIDGAIVTGINETEDAFGHMIVDIDGKACGCGNYGCLEAYCSIPAVSGAYASCVKKYGLSGGLPPPTALFHEFGAALASGDQTARRVADEAAAYLSVGLANFARLLNPRLVMLGGPLISECPQIYDTAVDMARRRLYGAAAPDKGGIFAKGLLSDEAVCTGAAAMVIRAAFNPPAP